MDLRLSKLDARHHNDTNNFGLFYPPPVSRFSLTVLINNSKDVSILEAQACIRARVQGILVWVVLEEGLDIAQSLLLWTDGFDGHLSPEAGGVWDAILLQVLLWGLLD